MASIDDFSSIANASAFIFTAAIRGPATHATVTAVVGDVLKAPVGMTGLAGREVTVHLSRPLGEGDYVLFANPASVGDTIAVTETGHLEASRRGEAETAMERGYATLLAPRLEAARLVALGTIGEVTQVFSPSERRGRPPWAVAPFEIERVLKGARSRRNVTLIGPWLPSKRLPRTPALRAGVHAILLMQRPPEEAMEHLPGRDRQAAGFVADTLDIQPPERAEDLLRILGATERE